MKKLIITSMFSLGAFLFAQEKAGLEKSITGTQVGFFGAEFYNEAKLAESWSFRSQIALYPSIWGGDLYSKTGFALAPAISVAPKYYYNLQKRKETGKNTFQNSGNYIAAALEYVPNWFVISNVSGIQVNEKISLIPTWGFRRNFAVNFNYEFKAGVGIGKILKKGYAAQVAPELSFKIGYDF